MTSQLQWKVQSFSIKPLVKNMALSQSVEIDYRYCCQLVKRHVSK